LDPTGDLELPYREWDDGGPVPVLSISDKWARRPLVIVTSARWHRGRRIDRMGARQPEIRTMYGVGSLQERADAVELWVGVGPVGITQVITAVEPRTFFALTFVASWLIWIPLVASRFGIGPLTLPSGTITLVGFLGVLMPATVAIVLTARREGRRGVGRLLGRLRIWRVGWRWWAAAVAVPAGLVALVGAIWASVGGQPPIEAVDLTAAGAVAVSVVFLLVASVGEEIGWRGVALPGLEQRTTALRASVVLGLLWSAWHLPFWLLQSSYDEHGAGYLVLNFLLILPSTVYITWFFNHSRFSILLPVAFHVAFNVANVAWLPVTGVIGPFVLLIAAEWVLAALVVRGLDVPGDAQAR
jgi:membrane protease YdiL (CAAX protease family)